MGFQTARGTGSVCQTLEQLPSVQTPHLFVCTLLLGSTSLCPSPDSEAQGEVGWAGGKEGLRGGHSSGCQAVPTQTGVTGCPCWSLSSYVLICSPASKQIWITTRFFLGKLSAGTTLALQLCHSRQSMVRGCVTRGW